MGKFPVRIFAIKRKRRKYTPKGMYQCKSNQFRSFEAMNIFLANNIKIIWKEITNTQEIGSSTELFLLLCSLPLIFYRKHTCTRPNNNSHFFLLASTHYISLSQTKKENNNNILRKAQCYMCVFVCVYGFQSCNESE